MKTISNIWQKEKISTYAIPVAVFLALMIVSSKIMVPLATTPVPITLQVLVVLLSGLVLGSKGAVFAQSSYLMLILLGAPITAFGLAGPAAFIGPTAGYLIAFLPAAYLVGLIKENSKEDILHLSMAAIAGIGLMYLGGTIWLSVYLGSFTKAFMVGAAPFIAVDLLKAAIAVSFAKIWKKSRSF